MQSNNQRGSSASRTVIVTAVVWLFAQLLLSATSAGALEPTEHIVWRKIPIALDLGVEQERMVHFPGPVSVGLPANLQGRLRIQSSGGTVYWLAQQPFPATRILVRALDDGQVYLFDVAASPEGGSAAPMEITLPRQPSTDSSDQTPAGPATHGYVSLTRFAAQQLYARRCHCFDSLGQLAQRTPVRDGGTTQQYQPRGPGVTGTRPARCVARDDLPAPQAVARRR